MVAGMQQDGEPPEPLQRLHLHLAPLFVCLLCLAIVREV